MKKEWIAAALILIVTHTSSLFAADAGEILAVRKKVVLERAGQRKQAEAQTPLLKEDAVTTGRASRAKLYFSDDSILNLGELSRVEVAEYLAQPGTDRTKSIYKLLDGTLKVVVGNSDLEIHTPTSVTAARGTKFYVTVRECKTEKATRPDGKCRESCIFVTEGEVTTRNIDKEISETVILKAGQSACVPLDGPPITDGGFSSETEKQLAAATSVFASPKIEAKENMSLFLRPVTNIPVPDIEQEPVTGQSPVTVIIKFP